MGKIFNGKMQMTPIVVETFREPIIVETFHETSLQETEQTTGNGTNDKTIPTKNRNK